MFNVCKNCSQVYIRDKGSRGISCNGVQNGDDKCYHNKTSGDCPSYKKGSVYNNQPPPEYDMTNLERKTEEPSTQEIDFSRIKAGDRIDIGMNSTYFPGLKMGLVVEKDDTNEKMGTLVSKNNDQELWIKTKHITAHYPAAERILTEDKKTSIKERNNQMPIKTVIVTQKTISPTGLQVTDEIIYEGKRTVASSSEVASFMAGYAAGKDTSFITKLDPSNMNITIE